MMSAHPRSGVNILSGTLRIMADVTDVMSGHPMQSHVERKTLIMADAHYK